MFAAAEWNLYQMARGYIWDAQDWLQFDELLCPNELPKEDLRQKFKKILQRVAYILASRKADNIENKAEIIDQYYNLCPQE